MIDCAGKILLPLLLSGVLAFEGGGQSFAAPPPFPIARDLSDLVRSASLIIVAKVDDIQRGRTAGEGEALLQFNNVRMKVERSLKGNSSTVTVVEQVAAGRRSLPPPVGTPYKVGERYLLFLTKGEGYRQVTIPQGRYLLQRGSVHPVEPGPVSDSLAGVNETKLIEDIVAIVRRNQKTSGSI